MRIHHATVKKAAKFKITLTLEDNEVVATAKDGTRLASGLQGNKVLEDAITKATGKPAKGKAKVAKLNPNLPSTHPANRGPKLRKAKMSPKEKACRDAGFVKTKTGFRMEGEEEEGSEYDATSWDELYIALIEDGTIEANDVRTGFKQKYKERYAPTHGRCGDDLGEQITAHCEVQSEDGRPQTGQRELQRFAEANGCWVPAYASLTNKFGTWNAGSARASVANRLRAKIRQAEKVGEKFKIEWA